MNTSNPRCLAAKAWRVFALLGLLGLAGLNPAMADSAVHAALTRVDQLAPSQRPVGVPGDYVVTPNGYFAADCVQTVHASEHLQRDGRILRADGSTQAAHACGKPRYTLSGERVVADGRNTLQATDATVGAGNAAPSISGWVENTNYSSSDVVGRIVADWSVPSAPSESGSQVIYFFPGLEQLPDVQSILQPVLGWNGYGDQAWTLASWNCCVENTTYHSDPIDVGVGDQLRGDTYANCSDANDCDSWSIVSEDLTRNTKTTLTTSPYAALKWVFGGVLEVYSVDDCAKLPASGSTVFHDIKVYDAKQNQIASPPWQNSGADSSLSPQCNYAVSNSSSSATLNY